MQRFCSIFSQLLQLFPRGEFEQAVRQHAAERHMRGFPCWGQFIAMLFCQLGQAHSLREICGGLAATEGELKHLGLAAGRSARRWPTPMNIVAGSCMKRSFNSCWSSASIGWCSAVAARSFDFTIAC